MNDKFKKALAKMTGAKEVKLERIDPHQLFELDTIAGTLVFEDTIMPFRVPIVRDMFVRYYSSSGTEVFDTIIGHPWPDAQSS